MSTFYSKNDYRGYLEHHGILGMKWGIRRFQNKDGSYTSAGKQRYGGDGVKSVKGGLHRLAAKGYEHDARTADRAGNKRLAESYRAAAEKSRAKADAADEAKRVKMESKALGLDKDYKNDDDFKRDLLKKNPYAAVMNPDAVKKWAGEHKKELLLGSAAVAAAVAIGVVAYKNRAALGKMATSMTDPGVQKAAQQTKLMHNGIDYAKPANAYMAAWCNADIHRFDPLPDLKTLTNDDAVELPAGHVMRRIVDRPFTSLRDGAEYICHSDDDAERYKAFLPKMWKANGAFGLKNFYQLEVECKTAVKAPGKKDSVDLMKQALRNVQGWNGLPPSPRIDRMIEDDVKKNFYRYQVNLIDRDNPLTKEYFRLAQAKGFNAVIDYNDAGRLADSPLILINGNKVGQVKNAVKMDMSAANEAMRNIKVPKALENFNTKDFFKEPNCKLYENYIKNFNRGAA